MPDRAENDFAIVHAVARVVPLRAADPRRPNDDTRKPDCLAGHVGLELRYVVTKYPFESSRRFAGIKPNSSHGDNSRLSCGVGQMQLGSSGRIILSRRSCAELVIELHRSRFAAAYRACDRKGPPILRCGCLHRT
jgi:hypothetical protein